MLYNINKFKEDFIEYDFDAKLIEENNELINSNEHYIDYKNHYIDSTKTNHDKLHSILQKFNILHNFYTKSDNNKYTYHFVDDTLKEEYNKEIKIIYIDQRNIFTDFTNHIDFLNNIKYTKVDVKNETVDKSRMSRLVNK